MHQCMEQPPNYLIEADWKLVRAFVAVMRTGTLTKAAFELKTTQPTIGRQIRALETLAGESYFRRRGNRLEPTDRAHAMYAVAADVEASLTGLARTMTAPASGERRIVRVTSSVNLATNLVPRLLAQLAPLYADLSFEVSATDAVENLLRRDADIAIRLTRPSQSGLVALKVGELPIGLYASRSYIERMGLPNSIEALLEHRFVADTAGQDVRDGAKRLGLNSDKMMFALCSASPLVRFGAVQAGMGIGAAVRLMADAQPNLTRILPQIDVASLPVWLVAHDDLHRSNTLRRVFDGLRELLSNELTTAKRNLPHNSDEVPSDRP
ncbi:MAG TPA: LysR family transcriptional regulator [Ramlibacter sp.]